MIYLVISIFILELSGKVYAGEHDNIVAIDAINFNQIAINSQLIKPSSIQLKSKMLGQKLMLDLRYFCADNTPSNQCRKPVTSLPLALSRLLTRHAIGGVILFTDNLTTVSQIRMLTEQLHATANDPTLPLFIAVDQEGGRVARLPTDFSPAFSGNMALGATFSVHQTHFAQQVASVIGQDLRALGINVNFAPTVDVNANPLNPVINVRSFSETVPLVNALGSAMTKSFQEQGVLAAIKHFPGHGDTVVDSHTGLPQVTHDKQTIMAQDIAPFSHIIRSADPAFVMTAHIQFPGLDNSTLRTTNGDQQIRPATLSRAILTDLLREQLQFNGLIVTDALDMAGIAQYFSPIDAVLETFNAGADIALMPFTIRNPQDIRDFDQFMHELTEKVHKTALTESYARISQVKRQLVGVQSQKTPEVSWTLPQKQRLAANLAKASITHVFGEAKSLLPAAKLLQHNDTEQTHILLVMPDELRCAGLTQALTELRPIALKPTAMSLECLSTTRLNTSDPRISPAQLSRYDVVITADISPQISLAEMGGMDDLSTLKALGTGRNSLVEQQQILKQILRQTAPDTHTVFVAMRTPYIINEFADLSDTAYAIYDYRVDETSLYSDSLNALAMYLLNDYKAPGVLPVSLRIE